MTTLLGTARQKTAATANSVLHKLNSLRSTVSGRTIEGAAELSSTIGEEASKISDDISEDASSFSIFTIIRYILIFLIFCFILLNTLAIIGLLPQSLAKFFNPILLFKYNSIVKGTPQKSAVIEEDGEEEEEDEEYVADVEYVDDDNLSDTTASDRSDALNTIRYINKSEKIVTSNDIDEDDSPDAPVAMQQLENVVKQSKTSSIPKPDTADSRTQLSQSSRKSGYCYIGEDRGFRSCIKVNESDKCISGKIFPTEAICINPTLRQ